ncbi:MAG: hypothetical protein FWF59_07165 [Turicibacter sp.]|nr:hypothetical protein [Turicibacter sp.]
MQKIWIAVAAALLCLSPTVARAQDVTPAQQICNPKTTWVKLESRKLWAQHAAWTDQAIRAILDDTPAQGEIVDRLLRNQDDIGDLFKAFYGNDAGAEVARILRGHIQLAGEVLTALRNDDKAAYKEAMTKWYANGDEFARYLNSLNPYWDTDVVRKMMEMHLGIIEKQAEAHHSQQWDKEIHFSDKGDKHLEEMADFLAAGIINQFPGQFEN